MPWAAICALIEPHYLNPLLDPRAGNGRPPVGLERMLRMYCIANWFNLADEACEDALYEVAMFREFCGFALGEERIADAGTLLNFHHLLEAHDLGAALFSRVGELLASGQRHEALGRHDGRCHADRRTPLDQEPGPGPRPGPETDSKDAPSEEKQSVALFESVSGRYEAAHRRGWRQWL